jgi:hypothetical protein
MTHSLCEQYNQAARFFFPGWYEAPHGWDPAECRPLSPTSPATPPPLPPASPAVDAAAATLAAVLTPQALIVTTGDPQPPDLVAPPRQPTTDPTPPFPPPRTSAVLVDSFPPTTILWVGALTLALILMLRR